ncbi:TonB-dependent receptor plug domain-containing protein [uncultured Algibacter sp.]|uniref:TonB-dependent receptor plug domain-containing protein n=1 Tax=uncultured Algibacter sp. TaxID=298659 RepID=UPI00260A8E7D|nr:TonB-dependent receptor plug domain-containing protein [uncultured Algibacter sp.]
MKIKNSHYFILNLFLFVCTFAGSAQEHDGKVALTSVLTTIQDQYGYQFNYAKDVVETYRISLPSKDLTFEEVIQFLKNHTDLKYTIIGSSFVLVTPPNKTLKDNLQQLPEVIVPSYIIKGISKLNTGAFKIDFSKFTMLPGLIEADVLQSIQAFPGIQSINENVSNISIRGGSHDQNLILWDGVKMYQSGHFFGLISMYNPQITEDVLLYKNGSDVSYTDGVSGTILMKTDNEINSDFKGNIGVNFIDANGFADIPISKRSSIQVALRKSISDFIQTPAYNNFFDKISEDTEVENSMNTVMNSDQEFDFYDVSFRWIYKLSDKDELRINFINVANELVFNENTEDESRQSNVNQNSIAGAVHYNKIWNSNWQTAVELYETDYKLKAVNANIADSQRFLQENIVSETSFKLKNQYQFSENISFLGGYHFVETEVTNLDDVDVPRFRSLISEVVRTHGLFSQLNYNSFDRRTVLNAGLRFNYIGKFKKQIWEPRLNFSHKFLDGFNVEVLGEMKHQNTSQVINFQNDFLGVEKRRWQLSNDKDIPVIRSQQVSFGVNYSKRGWQISADAYYKKVKNITAQSQGFQNQFEFVQAIGDYKANGVDFILRKQVNNFNIWLSYAFLNSDYQFETFSENEFPSNYNIRHATTLGTTYTNRNLRISTGLNWFSGNPTTLPVAGNEIVNNNINFEPSNSSELKDYLKLDISALYHINLGLKTKADIGASVWNLFNRNNQINNFFRVNNSQVDETLQTSLGFYPNLLMRVYF